MKTTFTKNLIPVLSISLLSILLTGFSLIPLQASEDDMDDPCCFIPHDLVTDCDELPYSFDPTSINQLQSLFGVPSGGNWGCQSHYWYEAEPSVYLNTCDVGHITRHFVVYVPDYWGNQTTVICDQVITIHPAHHYKIKFPEDESAYCSEPEPQDLEYEEFGCDLLAVSVNDLVFNISTDACYKILRTYRVINWCEYDGVSDPIIIGRDEDCDNVPGDECVYVIRKSNGLVFIDRNDNPYDYNPGIYELDPYCGHDGNPGYWRSFLIDHYSPYYNNRGFYQYTQHIKVLDDIKPVIQFDEPAPFCSISSNFSAGCPGPVDIPFSVNEECSTDLTVKVFFFENGQPVPLTSGNNIANEVLSGSYPNYVISGDFPIGGHAFEVHVRDGCGNTNSVLIPFDVVDCKAPAPICISGLTSGLMPVEPDTDADGDGDIDEGALPIWASDFLASPNSDCSPPIKYSINIQGQTPDINQSGIVITCDDGDFVVIEIYAWDSAFNPYAVQPDGTVGGPNYDHCVTYITIQNNQPGVCEVQPVVAALRGLIMTEQDSLIEGVEVLLDGPNDDTDMMTEEDGEYYFEEVMGGVGMDYHILPERDDDHTNGLSTADLIRLRKHLLEVDTLDSPYKLIAADVDKSGDINEDDWDELRRVVLHIDSVFSNNTSWRFIKADYDFPDESDPWVEAFPELITMEDLQEDYDSLNFVGVKVGDLNNSASTAREGGPQARNQQFAGVFAINLNNQKLYPGEVYTIDFTTDQMEDLLGYQFGLQLDPSKIELVRYRLWFGRSR